MKYTDQFIRKANLWYGDTGASLLVPQITISSGRSEREMATHSIILLKRILWTEEPGGLLSIGLHRVRNNWSNFACMHACIGEGNGNPLQYSCLQNLVDRGAWWAAVHRVAQSRTRLKWLSSSSSMHLYILYIFQSPCKLIRKRTSWWSKGTQAVRS